MELADDRLTRGNRRANAGNRLQELLDQGLDEEEERLLEALSDVSSDTSFHGSDEEAIDFIDSDFSDEEVEGTLEGEVIETEVSVRREERKERQEIRKRRLQRSQQFSASAAAQARQRANKRRRHEGDGSDDDDGDEIDFRAVGRRRPAPTIALDVRMAQALARAREAVASRARPTDSAVEDDDAPSESGGGAAHVGKITRSAAATSSLSSLTSPARRKRRLRGTRGFPPTSLLGMSERILEDGQVPESWFARDDPSGTLTYALFAPHCIAREGWLCSPTLPPLYLAAAQDRVTYAYRSPHVPEVFSINAKGRIAPVEGGDSAGRAVAGGGTKAGRARDQRRSLTAEAPVIAYVLAPPRSSWQPVGYRSGQSTLASSPPARTVISFASLPAVFCAASTGPA